MIWNTPRRSPYLLGGGPLDLDASFRVAGGRIVAVRRDVVGGMWHSPDGQRDWSLKSLRLRIQLRERRRVAERQRQEGGAS